MRLDAALFVRHGSVLLVALEPQQIVLTVNHAVEKHRHDLGEERMEVWCRSSAKVSQNLHASSTTFLL